MKIFITGINGFVGSCLANHFINLNYQVIGLGRQRKLAANVDPRCQYIIGDIKNPLAPIEADIVIHSAALATDIANYDEFYHNNVIGTKNVLAASINVSTFIQISTSSVYAFHSSPMQESDAGKDFEQLSNYGKTKFLSEQLIVENTHIGNKFILRPRAIYGKNDRIILPKLLKLIKGNKIILPAHITPQTSLTHINNLVAAAALCLQMKPSNKGTAIFNIADKQTYHLGHVIKDLLSAVTQRPKKVIALPKPVWDLIISLNEKLKFNKALTKFGAAEITKTAVLDITAAKENLGYEAKHDMYSSLTEISNWVQSIGGWKNYRDGKHTIK